MSTGDRQTPGGADAILEVPRVAPTIPVQGIVQMLRTGVRRALHADSCLRQHLGMKLVASGELALAVWTINPESTTTPQ